jgi:hypothetical protein
MSAAGPRPPVDQRLGTVELPDRSNGLAFDEDAAREARPRTGWYAYRVTTAAGLPPWADEVALTVERLAHPAPDPMGQAGTGEVPTRFRRGGLFDRTPAPEEPATPDPDPARLPSPADMPQPWDPDPADWAWMEGPEPEVSSPGWPDPERSSPGWPNPELSSPGWPDLGWQAGPVEALVLLRATRRGRLLGSLAEVAGEFEAVAGLRPAASRPRLLTGPALPGLVPATPATAQAHLGVAACRGLPAPLRRRQPAVAWAKASWRSSAGSVLTCEHASGTSAQAVIALRGIGNPVAIAPPPGGALVLRAWRGKRAWGLACGLVLGAAEALGLGREAGRAAAAARREGWDAAVLRGLPALHVARAGDPCEAPPEVIAHAASGSSVRAMLDACIAASRLTDPPGGEIWTLPVTP